ncbi:hypothetical protein HMPREF3229_01863 [Peptoniphilus harei]|uniref:Uncharacterized protein n=1 Tax=Peptoniphilus harei TaxID=54005 RepID=A0A133PGW3_9FIRM|nr:hypothetical protein [Peptoniphilus harei]KXA27792.1 hypothetical protein HMPREF3229_01863 [Peptoniphilus harei]MDU3456276.1 hypothetical protein [Peptoniphilus harei]MDU5184071.1 hypothetical protein [Peptoniphilus harei]MDU7532279.1 hypothetical protein [Peptoniphilus harei]
MKARDKYIITGVVLTVLLIIFIHFMPLMDLKMTSSYQNDLIDYLKDDLTLKIAFILSIGLIIYGLIKKD